MPSSLLLLLPLLGGYLFNHTFHRRRFRAQTKTGHRLIFEAAATGLAFLVVARVVTASLKAYGRPEWVLRVWPEVTGGVAFVGTSMLSVVLAFTTAVAWNLAVGFRHRDQVASDCAADRPLLLRWFYWFWESSYQYSLDLAVRVSGNALQRILHDVVVNGQVDGRCIGLTMKSGKIYSAWVTSSPNLSPEDEYVSLLPLMSGHRDKGTERVKYDFVYPVEKFRRLTDDSDVVMTVPVAEIQSAHLLDLDYWSREWERVVGGEETESSASEQD